MEQWSSQDTSDNPEQQLEGTFSAPTNNRKPSEDNRLPQPLLDGGLGKLHCTTHPTEVELPSTGPGMGVNKVNAIDLGDPDKKHRNEDAQQSQEPNKTNNKGERFHQSESSPLINCVGLRPRESTPTPEGAVTPLGEKVMVKWSNVLVNSSPTTVPTNIHSRACRLRLPRKEEVRIQKGGTLVGHWAVWGLICNEQAQHNPNFVPRQLLPQTQVRASSYEGQDNRGIDTSGVSAQTAAELRVGLQAPTLAATGNLVTGAETNKLFFQNKRRCQSLQDQQAPTSI
jgi:hypothetical protein